MTATNKLRKLLDERGVEWWNETDPEPQSVTMARAGERLIAYYENANGSIGYHVYNMHDLVPEQAIAATLGNAGVDDALALLDEANEQGRIEYRDYSQLHDAIATLGRRTCKAVRREYSLEIHDVKKRIPSTYVSTECGDSIYWPQKELFNYCPNCGRKAE